MSLFHPSVIKNNARAQSSIPKPHFDILEAWAQSLAKGTFDRETSHDGEFIQRILIDILGYKGSSSGAQWTVAKNQPVGSGNVDVALGHFTTNDTEIIAPFELKGAKTHDLDAMIPGRNKSPVQQAWEYAMDAKGAKWVLVSNYREIRLYAVGYGRKDFEKFDLSNLVDSDQYFRFLLLLSAENLLGGHTLSLLRESENKDKEITGRLYQDYKSLRAQMIAVLREDNPALPALEIVQHTQTILDRILFVAFAEDRSLLPKDTLKSCYEDRGRWNPQPAWNNFKGLFGFVDRGHPPLIPGYNGGLFAPNDALDNLSVSDALCEGFKAIGEYDFGSDVSVNILGHIFEQSITDLETIRSALSGDDDASDYKQSKRKKDGIFYTPAYITHYIVEQAVGGWLKDRKKEIGFDELPVLSEEDYASVQPIKRGARKGTVTYNKRIEQHIKAWELYKDALSRIKVLDPACGSGAFLNEVFDYLYREGLIVNSELTTLNAGQAKLFRWDTHILANNIYGVDINHESVAITKLSLWLKTANRNEKLTYLDDNIKCGNSLIDDRAIAAASAFEWEAEFPDIVKHGFDVVLGNPPYLGGREWKKDKESLYEYFANKFAVAEYQFDMYVLFWEQCINLCKPGGFVSLITPNTWLNNQKNQKLREYILQYMSVRAITDYSHVKVFEDAVVLPIVTTLQKVESHLDKVQIFLAAADAPGLPKFKQHADQKLWGTDPHKIFHIDIREDEVSLREKIENGSLALEGFADVRFGVKIYETGKGQPPQTPEAAKNGVFEAHEKLDNHYRPFLTGKDIEAYTVKWPNSYLKYGPNLAAPREPELFSGERLVVRRIVGRTLIATYLDTDFVTGQLLQIVKPKDKGLTKYLLAILNSNLMAYYFRKKYNRQDKTFPEIRIYELAALPIKLASNISSFVEKVDILLSANNELREFSTKFVTLLKSELDVEKLSDKLDQWYQLDFTTFCAELSKKKLSFALARKAEWIEHFEKQKVVATELKLRIDVARCQIDDMVYALYGLTLEEIANVVSG